MKELGITKGVWKKFVKHRGSTKDALIQVKLPDGQIFEIGRITDDDCTVETCCRTEEHANAKLIADAGTTANKCGLFPSELLRQRDELLDALEMALPYLKHHCMDMMPEVAEKAINNTKGE